MHAVVIRDGTLRWEERDDPVHGDTELLVAVRAAGINGADMAQRAGGYPAPPGWPQEIPGMEFAGEVVAAGRQVTLFAPGDRVMAVVGGGAQAELARVDESHALAVPDCLPWPGDSPWSSGLARAALAAVRHGQIRIRPSFRGSGTGASRPAGWSGLPR